MRFNSGSCFFFSCFFLSLFLFLFFFFSNQHEALKLEKKNLLEKSIYINVEIYTIYYKKVLFSKGEIDAEWFLFSFWVFGFFFFFFFPEELKSVHFSIRARRDSVVIQRVVRQYGSLCRTKKKKKKKEDQSPARPAGYRNRHLYILCKPLF